MRTTVLLFFIVLGISINAQIQVRTAQELVDNAKTGATLQLVSKKYVMSELKSSSNPHISFESVFGSTGKEVHIKGVHNLTIDGSKLNGDAEFLTEPTYGNVLVFEDCKNLTIKYFIAGHGTEKGQCLGGVLKFDNCYKVKIEQAILYGSGTYGITANNTTVLECKDVIIKECTYGILDFNKVERFSFEKCSFKNNRGYDMINLKNSSGSFELVKAYDNKTEHGYFINASNSQIVSVSMILERDNKFKNGLCNDWSNFARIDFFGFLVDGPVDPGLARRLNYEEPDNRFDLMKKWKLESFKARNEKIFRQPKKPLFMEFKANGSINFIGENTERMGKFSWSPLGEENIYISVQKHETVYAMIAKVYKKENGVSLSMLLNDLAEINLVPAEKSLLNEKTVEKTEKLRYAETSSLPEGEAMISFKYPNGGFINFIVDIAKITPVERRFVVLDSRGQAKTNTSIVNKEFKITYDETTGEDPDMGGGITIVKIKKAVGITIIPDNRKKVVTTAVDSFSTEPKVANKNNKYPHVNDDIGKAVSNNELAHFIRTNASYKYISTDGKLTKVQFRNKGLTTLPECLKELNFLEELDISNNNFASIPEVVFEIGSLKVLKLGNNQIESISGNISKLNKLTSVYAINNKIKELPAAIGNIFGLRVLHFSKNQIAKIDANIGMLSSALYDLDLSQNQITDLPDAIGNCSRITHLDLSNNHIRVLPSSICKLSRMKVLKVQNTNLNSLPDNIGYLQNLKKLWINNTSVKTVPASIYSLDKLKELGKGRNYSRTKAEKKNTEAFVNRVMGLSSGNSGGGFPTKN